jgi:hypothetical protein
MACSKREDIPVTEPFNESTPDLLPHEKGIEDLLRQSMSAPAPTLSTDFDRRLMRKLNRNSKTLDRYRRILLAGYGLVSVVACAVVMRGQGLAWGPVAGMIVAPLILVVTARSMRRTT